MWWQRDLPPDSNVMLEPNLQQTFFCPVITQLEEGLLTVQNKSSDLIQLKKNCQAFSMYTTSPYPPFSSTNPSPLDIPLLKEKSTPEIIKDI